MISNIPHLSSIKIPEPWWMTTQAAMTGLVAVVVAGLLSSSVAEPTTLETVFWCALCVGMLAWVIISSLLGRMLRRMQYFDALSGFPVDKLIRASTSAEYPQDSREAIIGYLNAAHPGWSMA